MPSARHYVKLNIDFIELLIFPPTLYMKLSKEYDPVFRKYMILIPKVLSLHFWPHAFPYGGGYTSQRELSDPTPPETHGSGARNVLTVFKVLSKYKK